jgi:hypothetical protein
MSKKSVRPVPVIAVEIRSPCAISFNHSQYVTRSVPVGPIASPHHLENSFSKPTGRRAWYPSAGMSVPFQPSNLGIALSCARLRPGNIVARGAGKEDQAAG